MHSNWIAKLPYLFQSWAVMMRHMKMKIGDKVRSTGGVEGVIVSRSAERRSVMVKVPGVWRTSGVVSIPLDRLRFISGYSVDDIPPTSDLLGILRRRPR
jgi:hypothetical protein